MLTYLEISAQTWKKEIGIQKNPMKSAVIMKNLKHHPLSWTTAEHYPLGSITRIIRTWKQARAKVILSTADTPKHAEETSSSSFYPVYSLQKPQSLESCMGFNVNISTKAISTQISQSNTYPSLARLFGTTPHEVKQPRQHDLPAQHRAEAQHPRQYPTTIFINI